MQTAGQSQILGSQPRRTLYVNVALSPIPSAADAEPARERALEELDRRRVDATRERLVSAEGIAGERLSVAGAKPADTPPGANGARRVALQVEARAD